METALKTTNLTKYYGSTLALENLSLEVNKGEIFGYLGPNGAGKTTTIRTLLDFIRPSSGSAQVLGMDSRADSIQIHKRIGYLPSELSLPKGRKGKQLIRHFAELRGMSDVTHAYKLADKLQLDLSKKVRDYSSGNKRKLGLVLALMHKPELLILDEPTSGLDPLMQNLFNQMMLELRDNGVTVFLSSHQLTEVQAICERVAILRDGILRAVENVDDLTHVDFRWITVHLRDAISPETVSVLKAHEGISNIKQEDKVVTLRLVGDIDPVFRAISDNYIKDMTVQQPTLEEIFLNFYGENRNSR